MTFDPLDPFPLLAPEARPHALAQAHAEAADAWLGLRTHEIERALMERGALDAGQQQWVGLPVKSLLTPYVEIRAMLSELLLQPGQLVIDLGAGYGRMGFVVGKHHPGVRFVGYENVPERVAEARRCLARWNYPEVEMRLADLSAPDFAPEPAEAYFIYDYGTREAIEKSLQDIRSVARDRRVAVVGRGRATRDAIERKHPWLSQVVEPVHRGNYSIYRSG